MPDDHLHDALLYGFGAQRVWPGATIHVSREEFYRKPGTRKAKDVWVIDHQPSNSMHYGVTWDDGEREVICQLSAHDFLSQQQAEDYVMREFVKRDIDLKEKQQRAKQRQAAIQAEIIRRKRACMDELLREFSAHLDLDDLYRRSTDDSVRRAAREGDPERKKAIARCRVFKDMISRASTNEGERSNARDAMARLMEKHSITERDL